MCTDLYSNIASCVVLPNVYVYLIISLHAGSLYLINSAVGDIVIIMAEMAVV